MTIFISQLKFVVTVMVITFDNNNGHSVMPISQINIIRLLRALLWPACLHHLPSVSVPR